MKTLILLSLVLSASAFAANTKPKAKCDDEANYPLITTAELKAVADKKEATIFDVNSDESFKEAQVTGAVHYGSVKGAFAKHLPKSKDAMIVAYCGGPACTAWLKAASQACKAGYTNIKHYKEGISGWKKEQHI